MFSIAKTKAAQVWSARSPRSVTRTVACLALALGIGLLASHSAQARVGAPTINPGDYGDAVRCVQGALQTYAGKKDLKVDGHFGPATKAAVQDLQRVYGLDPDGYVGPLTGDAINSTVVFGAHGDTNQVNFWNYTCLNFIPTTEGLGTP